MSVRQLYEAALQERGYTSDAAQVRAIEALERCAAEWSVYKQRRSNSLKKLFVNPDIPHDIRGHPDLDLVEEPQFRGIESVVEVEHPGFDMAEEGACHEPMACAFSISRVSVIRRRSTNRDSRAVWICW